MQRRHFLSLSLGSSFPIVASSADEAARAAYDPPSDEQVTISLLHTTDLHGHIRPTTSYGGMTNVGGIARCMTQLRKWRKSSPHHLTLDIGDLYQGTHASLATKGELMVQLLNQCQYDAWVAGNHDFDWGEDVFRRAVELSGMPVLSANLQADGFLAGHQSHRGSAYAGLLPTMVREKAGIRIGIIGLTTPGLPFWLNPSQLGSIATIAPLVALEQSIAQLYSQDVHSIVLAGHMGLKRGDGDDYANQVNRLLQAFPEIDVYIGGHTHRDRPSTVIGHTLFTQAGYHGIWAGRVDLTFRADDKRLIRRDAETLLMDDRIDEDPMVLATAKEALDLSDSEMNKPMGKLALDLKEGRYGDVGPDSQSLICAGIRHALGKRGEKIDGVLHGSFSDDTISAGQKTLADLWEIIPYENRIVSADITGEQLMAIIKEAFNSGFGKKLFGFHVESRWDGLKREREISQIRRADGKPIDRSTTYRIAFNSYDAQSGGRKLMVLRDVLLKFSSNTVYHPIDTRAALADWFLDQGEITAEHLQAAR